MHKCDPGVIWYSVKTRSAAQTLSRSSSCCRWPKANRGPASPSIGQWAKNGMLLEPGLCLDRKTRASDSLMLVCNGLKIQKNKHTSDTRAQECCARGTCFLFAPPPAQMAVVSPGKRVKFHRPAPCTRGMSCSARRTSRSTQGAYTLEVRHH